MKEFVIPADVGNPLAQRYATGAPTLCLHMASKKHGTLYIGVTSDLPARIYQHREKTLRGFTAKYDVQRLVWFESHETMESAVVREKRLKKWLRNWKIELIEQANPQWRDFATDFGFDPRH